MARLPGHREPGAARLRRDTGRERGTGAHWENMQALAAIRNAPITPLRDQGWESLTESLSQYEAHTNKALALLNSPLSGP